MTRHSANTATATADLPGSGGNRRGADVLAGVGGALDGIFTSLGPLADRFRELVSDPDDRLNSDDLAGLRPIIFDLLQRHAGLVGGAGIITAPDLLTDMSHWLEWWWTGPHGKPEALRVDPNPAAPDFFDYVTADWYATPIRTGVRRIAGPYVDYICTTEYSVTLSIPVTTQGLAVGVVAADVPISSLETLVVPALLEIDQPAALVSADGRIIASNSPDRLPGDRIDPGPEPIVLTWASWLLVIGR